jgi:hypothetical protein
MLVCPCHRPEAATGITSDCQPFIAHPSRGVMLLQVAAAHAAAAAAEEQQRLQEAERKETRARLQVGWWLVWQGTWVWMWMYVSMTVALRF